MERVILHSDLNNFYASAECLDNAALRGKPVAVCGDPALRHGIVLAKSYEAKAFGVATGQAIWEARSRCPGLVVVPPRYQYTDQVEPFGLDESWLDVGGSASLFGDGKQIADTLRRRIKGELGLTVSVGVSFNKVFAKLGSDYRKPDATSVITRENYRELVWTLPVSDLLYVGPATTRKLGRYGVYTIGALAQSSPDFLHAVLGKVGVMLWQFANGLDRSGVSTYYAMPPVKSVGNSTTAPRDLVSDDDVKITLYALCESVAARLREQRCLCSTVQLGIRDNTKITLYALCESVAARLREQRCLCSTVQLGIRDNTLLRYERQEKLPAPASNSTDLFDAAFHLFCTNRPSRPVRSLSVRACGLSPAEETPQLSLFPEDVKRRKREDLEQAVDRIRAKYGYTGIRRGIQLLDPALDLDAKGSHIIHPIIPPCPFRLAKGEQSKLLTVTEPFARVVVGNDQFLIHAVRRLGHAVGAGGVEDVELFVELQNERAEVVGHHHAPFAAQQHVVEPMVIFLWKFHLVTVLRLVIGRIAVEKRVFPVILPDQALKVLVLNHHISQPP